MLRSILTKKEAFSYPLTTYPLALSTAQGTLYKPRMKNLFRNYLINSSAAFVEIPSELNPVVIYDAIYGCNLFCSITTNMGGFIQNSY